jgi:hypothetical protein
MGPRLQSYSSGGGVGDTLFITQTGNHFDYRYGTIGDSRFATVRHWSLDIVITGWTLNSDNSLTATVQVCVGDQWTQDNSTKPGYLSHVEAWLLNGTWKFWDFYRYTDDLTTIPSPGCRTTSVTIPPQGSSDISVMTWQTSYPHGQYSPAVIQSGVRIYNDNLPTYIPMQGKKNNTFKSFNDYALEGKKNSAYKTILNRFGDNAGSQGQGKKNDNFIRLEKE